MHVHGGFTASGSVDVGWKPWRALERWSIHIVVYLIGVNPMTIGSIQLNDLNMKIMCERIKVSAKGKRALTPPDLGILTTVKRFPYVRCISTFSFSCPTTRIVLTVKTRCQLREHRGGWKRSVYTSESIDAGFDEHMPMICGHRARRRRKRRWCVDNESGHTS